MYYDLKKNVIKDYIYFEWHRGLVFKNYLNLINKLYYYKVR